MLGSFSIFLKICPECAGEVSVAAERCGCGHVFESTHASHLSPDELVLRDEELYENYLVARVEQARQAIAEAEFVLAEDPGNLIKVQTAELTREAAASMEANLSAQRGKVEALRRLVDLARPAPAKEAPPQEIVALPVAPAAAKDIKPGPVIPSAPAPRATVSAEPPARIDSVVSRPQKNAGTAKPPIPVPPPAPVEKAVRVLRAIRRVKTREAPAKPINAPPVEARSAAATPAAPRPERGSATSSPSAPRAPVTSEPSARPVAAASRPQRDPAVPAPAAKTPAPAPAPPSVPVSAIKPSASPPQAGARKETPARPGQPRPTPVITSTPPESFRAEQAARAEQALRKRRAEAVERYPSWDCPNCTATVPENSARCGCGYSYHSGTNDLPDVSAGAGISAGAK